MSRLDTVLMRPNATVSEQCCDGKARMKTEEQHQEATMRVIQEAP